MAVSASYNPSATNGYGGTSGSVNVIKCPSGLTPVAHLCLQFPPAVAELQIDAAQTCLKKDLAIYSPSDQIQNAIMVEIMKQLVCKMASAFTVTVIQSLCCRIYLNCGRMSGSQRMMVNGITGENCLTNSNRIGHPTNRILLVGIVW